MQPYWYVLAGNLRIYETSNDIDHEGVITAGNKLGGCGEEHSEIALEIPISKTGGAQLRIEADEKVCGV